MLQINSTILLTINYYSGINISVIGLGNKSQRISRGNINRKRKRARDIVSIFPMDVTYDKVSNSSKMKKERYKKKAKDKLWMFKKLCFIFKYIKYFSKYKSYNKIHIWEII